VITVDGVLPQQEEPFVVIGDRPENPRGDLNLTRDFRDPNVFLGPNGYYYMTLGSKDQLGKGGVILLYRTKEKSPDSEWQFQVGWWINWMYYFKYKCIYAIQASAADRQFAGHRSLRMQWHRSAR